MKIILPKIVEKDLFKILISDKSIEALIKKIKTKKIDDIYLKRPFVKIKVSFFGLTLRLIGEYRKIDGILVLVLFFKKSDKNYGNNLVWSKEIEDKIKIILPKIVKNLKNNDFKIY